MSRKWRFKRYFMRTTTTWAVHYFHCTNHSDQYYLISSLNVQIWYTWSSKALWIWLRMVWLLVIGGCIPASFLCCLSWCILLQISVGEFALHLKNLFGKLLVLEVGGWMEGVRRVKDIMWIHHYDQWPLQETRLARSMPHLRILLGHSCRLILFFAYFSHLLFTL